MEGQCQVLRRRSSSTHNNLTANAISTLILAFLGMLTFQTRNMATFRRHNSIRPLTIVLPSQTRQALQHWSV